MGSAPIDPTAVGQTFLSARGNERDPAASAEAIGRRIDELHVAARERWPGVTLHVEVFARALGHRLRDAVLPAEQALAGIHAADVYLAVACEAGDRAAVEAFDRVLLSRVPGHLSHMRRGVAFAEDITQEVRERLFVPQKDGRLRVAEYRGSGPLDGWVRTIALRRALKRVEEAGERQRVDDAEALADMPGMDDPEIESIKARHAGEFKAVLAAAMAALEPEQRAILRAHFVEGFSTPQLGRIYQVHQTTAYRRLEAAQDAFIRAARDLLHERFGLTSRELDSLGVFLRSRIGASFLVSK